MREHVVISVDRPRPAGRRWPAVACAAAALVLPACGFSNGPGFQIGLKRVALDLAFKDESKAQAPIRKEIFIPQPVQSVATFVTQVVPTLFPPANPQPVAPPELIRHPECAVASPAAKPVVPATVFVYDPPAVGYYQTHNTGKFTIAGAFSISLPYPQRGFQQVTNVKKTKDLSDQVKGPTDVITYDLVQHGFDGSQTSSTYRTLYSPSAVTSTVTQTAQQGHAPQGELDLVKTVTVNSQGTNTFQPSPPVELMGFKSGQGTSWNSAGIDQVTGTSMVVQGQTVQRARVDLCGQVYDTYEVSSTERVANLRTSFTSQTNQPNIYDVATQYGGLFIREHIDTTTTYQSGGKPVVITLNYDQVLNSITPQT